MGPWFGAIDCGGTKTAMALIAGDGRIGARLRFPTPERPAPGAFCDLLAERWRALLAQAGGPGGAVVGVGLAAPGPADAQTGMLHRVFDWPWRDVPLAAELSARLGLPVRLDNDVRCCCLAESRWGVARGVADFVWVQISTGVGGALCLGGRPYAGSGGLAGEVGHLVLDEGGPLCRCGRHGCLQALVSGPAIAARFAATAGPAAWGEAAQGDAAGVFAAAERGDARAREVVAGVARDLGRGLALVCNLLDPRLLVLGGGVMESLRSELPAVQAAMRERVLLGSTRQVSVVPSAVGYDAALLGAGTLAALGAAGESGAGLA